MNIIEMRPPRIGMTIFIAALAVQYVLPAWCTVALIPNALGVPLGLTGVLIMLWAWGLFKKHNLAICPTAPTNDLLTAGPYWVSRNPMYLGMLLIFLGAAVYFESPALYVALIIYFGIFNFIFIPYEEEKLRRSFGSRYSDYRKKARRWL